MRAHGPILSPWRRWLLVEIGSRPGATARQIARAARHADRRVRVAVVYERIRCAIRGGLLEQREHPGDRRVRRLYLTPIGEELVLDIDRSRPVPVPGASLG